VDRGTKTRLPVLCIFLGLDRGLEGQDHFYVKKKFFIASTDGVAQWTSRTPQEQKTRVRNPTNSAVYN
jgi:hypothetical protein